MTQKEVRCPSCVVDDKFHPSSVLGKSGSIVVYSAFESQGLAELAAWLPEFAGRIKKIQRRLWDLLTVVRNHVYHPNFAGSYSIKNVLPALVPGMTYEGMEVADGTDAGLAWGSLIRGGLDQAERDRVRKALLEYCTTNHQNLARREEFVCGAARDSAPLAAFWLRRSRAMVKTHWRWSSS
jgi:hypothetical protein